MFEAQEINAEHKDLIHDVAYDYYGERMATCSSDQYVKVSKKAYLTLNIIICNVHYRYGIKTVKVNGF